MDKMNLISYFWNHSLLSYRVYNEHYFLALRSYNPRQKSWHDWPLLQHLSQKLISSYPSPRFNVVYRDEFVIARFQHCLGGGGSYFSDVITDCFQNSLSTHFHAF